ANTEAQRMLRLPLTRIASAMRSDLSPQAGRGEDKRISFSAFRRPLIARLPSRIMVTRAEADIVSGGFVASGGVSVAYRVAFSAHAAPPDARGRHGPRRLGGAGAAAGRGRGPVRLLLRRPPEAAAGSPGATGEFLRRSVRPQP